MKRKFISKAAIVTLSATTVLSPMVSTSNWMPIAAQEVSSTESAKDFEIDNGTLKKYNGTSETVVIPDNVKKIDRYAFVNNNTMVNVEFPKGLEYIEESAFQGCTKLKSIELPTGLKGIYNAAFWYCSSLEKVSLPDGLTTLSGGLFGDCTSLTEITLPQNLTYIDDSVFRGCTNLSTIVFPDTSPTFGYGVFEGTKWLADKQKENPLVTYEDTLLDGSACTGVVTVPEGITRIAGNAFYTDNITQIILPKSLERIDDYAFNHCTALTNIRIPENVTYLGSCLWINCINLTHIAVPKTVTQIDELAFNYASGFPVPPKSRNSAWTIYGEKGSEAEKVINAVNEKIIESEKDAERDAALLPDDIKESRDKMAYWGKTLDFKDISEYEEDIKNITATPDTPSATATPSAIAPTETPAATSSTEVPTAAPTATSSTAAPTAAPTATSSTEAALPTPAATTPTETSIPTPTGIVPTETPIPAPTTAPTKKPKVTVARAKINKASRKSGTKIAVTIKKLTGVKGYQIVVATDKNFKKNVKKAITKKNTYSFKNLKKKKTYYIKARAYKLNSNKEKIYGKYSAVKKVK